MRVSTETAASRDSAPIAGRVRAPRFAALTPKESWSEAQPFRRLKVKVKPEIIRMNRPTVRPDQAPRAPALAPATLARWLDQGHDDAGLHAEDARRGPLRGWLFRQHHGRPFVTAKIASGVDGRIAAPDGTSQWITGPQARDHAHTQRARIDAIVIGTGTALADNPTLTARTADGALHPHQPARVVLGHRDIPADARLRDPAGGPLVRIDSHDPADVLAALPDALWVLVEGGPHILGAFFAAGLVDEVHAYVAPLVLGAGRSSVEIPGVTTLDDGHRFSTRSVTRLGEDVLVTLSRPSTTPGDS